LVVAVPGLISLLIVAAAELAEMTGSPGVEIEVAAPIEVASSAFAALAGLSLVLRSRYSRYLLGALSAVLAGFIFLGTESGLRQFVWLAIYIATFLFSAWARRAQHLGKRPNDSSKPTPLRGAA
jgi:hypothetical protein